jgi:hypothetical protein
MKFSLSRIAGIIVLLMWAVSLALPVFTTCRPGYDYVGGWFLLGFGWFGIMALQPAWFANWLIVIIAAILSAERRAPIWLGVVTVIVAGCAWYFTDWYDDTGNVPIRSAIITRVIGFGWRQQSRRCSPLSSRAHLRARADPTA